MLLYIGSEIIHISANDILAVWFLQSVHISHVVADKTSMGILANIDAIGARARLRHLDVCDIEDINVITV